MIIFEEFYRLFENADQNKHLDHLEELILKYGAQGANRAISYLENILDVLESNTKGKINANIKFDGSPAFIFGRDPNDKFFVGSKSVFNVSPKINYNEDDIRNNHANADGLIDKLVNVFNMFKNSNIDSVYQGDYLFDNHIKETRVIENEEYITFRPNTILYAVPYNSEEGRKISNSSLGVVLHTEYDCYYDNDKLRFKVKQYGVDSSKINVDNVYIKDSYFRSEAGYITLTSDESNKIRSIINKATDLAKIIDFDINIKILDYLNIYLNTEIRRGEFINNVNETYKGFFEWLRNRYLQKIDKLKSVNGKKNNENKLEELLNNIRQYEQTIINILYFQLYIKQAKDIIIKKYNNISKNLDTKHYLFDSNGDLVITDPEGYIAVDITGNAVKFVDRLEFSRANFNNEYR